MSEQYDLLFWTGIRHLSFIFSFIFLKNKQGNLRKIAYWYIKEKRRSAKFCFFVLLRTVFSFIFSFTSSPIIQITILRRADYYSAIEEYIGKKWWMPRLAAKSGFLYFIFHFFFYFCELLTRKHFLSYFSFFLSFIVFCQSGYLYYRWNEGRSEGGLPFIIYQ